MEINTAASVRIGTDLPTDSSIDLKQMKDLPFCRVEHFPSKLYRMLEAAHSFGFTNVISWSDDGRSFIVHKPKVFAKTMMVIYFNQSKYKSFQRQLNLYEFIRSPRDNILGVYSHPFFCRGQREQCMEIRRPGKKSRPHTKVRLPPIVPILNNSSTLDNSSSSETSLQSTKNPLSLNQISSWPMPNFQTNKVHSIEIENTEAPLKRLKTTCGDITTSSFAGLHPYLKIPQSLLLQGLDASSRLENGGSQAMSDPFDAFQINTNLHMPSFAADDDEGSIGTIDSISNIEDIVERACELLDP